MPYVVVLIIGLGALDIPGMVKRKAWKQVVVWAGIAGLTLLLASYYISPEYRPSICEMIFKIVGLTD